MAVYDTLADWEHGHLLAEIHTGRFTGKPFDVVTVAPTLDPITTMGGVRIDPDLAISDLDSAGSDLLILPGAELWDAGGGGDFANAAADFIKAGVPVAAICGATLGLARIGLLDDRPHTSAALAYLETAEGYAGAEKYVDDRAVAAGGLITAGPDSPVQFAAAVLGELGLMNADVCAAYEAVFSDSDASQFPALMAAQA